MEAVTQGVVLLHSMHDVFVLERLLKGAGVDCRPIPVPRQFSSDCGSALRFNWKDRTEVELLLEGAVIEHGGLHVL